MKNLKKRKEDDMLFNISLQFSVKHFRYIIPSVVLHACKQGTLKEELGDMCEKGCKYFT